MTNSAGSRVSKRKPSSPPVRNNKKRASPARKSRASPNSVAARSRTRTPNSRMNALSESFFAPSRRSSSVSSRR
jgi:hypothetical protein